MRKASHCLKSKGRFNCSSPLEVRHPYPIVATSNQTKIGDERLLENCPKNQRIPSLLSNDRSGKLG